MKTHSSGSGLKKIKGKGYVLQRICIQRFLNRQVKVWIKIAHFDKKLYALPCFSLNFFRYRFV